MVDKPDDEVIKAGVEVIKLAYTDAFQPVAKEVGKSLGLVGKAVNMALAPVKMTVWGYEQIEGYVNETVTNKLAERKVKGEDVITPDPDVAVPTIEALRYSKLKNEYANLLATSMTKSRINEAHPAYVEILKQLVPDEARVLKYMKDHVRYRFPLIILWIETTNKGELNVAAKYDLIIHNAKCSYPQNEERYFNNLERLGLIEILVDRHFVENSNYTLVLKRKDVVDFLETTDPRGKPKIKKSIFFITPLGQAFINACLD